MAYAAAILITVLILYAVKINGFSYSWKKYPEFIPDSDEPRTNVSIVIAFRNEKDTIGRLLNSLAHQEYPVHLREIILIDDHSIDGSENLVREFCDSHHGFRLLQSDGEGKKAAISKGIRHSANDLIITTDADCEMENNWLNTFCDFYKRMKPDMILGLVDLIPLNHWFFSYQRTEFVSLVASGAAAAAHGKPVYSNGANMAFSKRVFESLNNPLFSETGSGDDTFLLHGIKAQGKKILVLRSSFATVRTAACKTVSDYINQRIRWTSKARFYKDRDTIYLALLVAAANISIVASLILIVAGMMPWLFFVLLGVKYLSDYRFLNNYLESGGQQLSAVRFLVFSIIYPMVTLFLVTAGISGVYSWKGRKYNR